MGFSRPYLARDYVNADYVGGRRDGKQIKVGSAGAGLKA
jgi:hypothetical protein